MKHLAYFCIFMLLVVGCEKDLLSENGSNEEIDKGPHPYAGFWNYTYFVSGNSGQQYSFVALFDDHTFWIRNSVGISIIDGEWEATADTISFWMNHPGVDRKRAVFIGEEFEHNDNIVWEAKIVSNDSAGVNTKLGGVSQERYRRWFGEP